jgi:tRNA threonylcarbamoyladenosine biosynthesis protein TsaB
MAASSLDYSSFRVVAIDTSSADGSVAAVEGGRETVERLPVANEHARDLAAAVVAVVGRAGWTLDAVSCIAVVRGPGSFTGLRVGVTTAKTLAWAIPTRLVGVSAVEGIARQVRRTARPLCSGGLGIAFDAGRGEVHACTARFDGDAVVASPGSLVLADAWIDSLPAGSVVAGPALVRLRAAVARRADLVIAPEEAWLPFAPAVAEAAVFRARADRFDDPHSLVPEYMRPSYAEEPRPGTRP